MDLISAILALLGETAAEYPFMAAWIAGIVLCVMFLNLYYIFVSIFKHVGGY